MADETTCTCTNELCNARLYYPTATNVPPKDQLVFPEYEIPKPLSNSSSNVSEEKTITYEVIPTGWYVLKFQQHENSRGDTWHDKICIPYTDLGGDIKCVIYVLHKFNRRKRFSSPSFSNIKTIKLH